MEPSPGSAGWLLLPQLPIDYNRYKMYFVVFKTYCGTLSEYSLASIVEITRIVKLR